MSKQARTHARRYAETRTHAHARTPPVHSPIPPRLLFVCALVAGVEVRGEGAAPDVLHLLCGDAVLDGSGGGGGGGGARIVKLLVVRPSYDPPPTRRGSSSGSLLGALASRASSFAASLTKPRKPPLLT